MKLNEKGLQRLKQGCSRIIENGLIGHHPISYEQIEALRNYDFESYDFDDGVVVLSLEDAKAVLECVDACAYPSPFEGFVSLTVLLRDRLKMKINQVEGE